MHSVFTSSDEDDLSSKAGDVGVWVEGGGRHCSNLLRLGL